MKTTRRNLFLLTLAISAAPLHADTTLNATTSVWGTTAPLTGGNVFFSGGFKGGTAGLGGGFEFRLGGVLISKGTQGTSILSSPALLTSDQGVGTRLLWHPRKAAFRAGNISLTPFDQWSEANIGNYSTAFGQNTTASGANSFAAGNVAKASGANSTAFGANTIASAGQSTALGNGTTASGDSSTAMGAGTRAESLSSTAVGSFNVGGGSATVWTATDPIFEIGNSQLGTPRSNAVTVLKNGNTTIAGTLTSGAITATGAITSAGQAVVTASPAGVINLTGSGVGISAGGFPVFSLDVTGKVNFASNRPTSISNTTVSTSPTTGALIVAGGLGVDGAVNTGADANINGVRVGKGGGSVATNSVIGLSALAANTTGSENMASGNRALYSNTTGSYNVASGAFALYSNTTGGPNTASGVYTLSANTTGGANTASGAFALNSNTTGGGNTACGAEALSGNQTGSRNVAIGEMAGVLDRNWDVLSSIEGCVFIGAGTHAYSSSDYNTIVIGDGARGVGPNSTVIGNPFTENAILYGNLSTRSISSNGGITSNGDITNFGRLTNNGNTTLNGKVTISAPQGDISMGIYQ
jgi:hypothetical protein